MVLESHKIGTGLEVCSPSISAQNCKDHGGPNFPSWTSAKRPHRSYHVVIYYNVVTYYRIWVVRNTGWGDLLARIDYAFNNTDGLNFGRRKFLVTEYENINAELPRDKGDLT